MSDAVISPGEDYLHLLDTVAVPRWVFADFLNNQPGWPDTARRYLNAPALAASTPVGGCGHTPGYRNGPHKTCSLCGQTHWSPEMPSSAPPPPSVSIDNGSAILPQTEKGS